MPGGGFPALALALELAFLAAMLFAVARDIAGWSLPNWISIPVALGYLPWAWATGAGLTTIEMGLAGGAFVFVLGLLFYWWGIGVPATSS